MMLILCDSVYKRIDYLQFFHLTYTVYLIYNHTNIYIFMVIYITTNIHGSLVLISYSADDRDLTWRLHRLLTLFDLHWYQI